MVAMLLVVATEAVHDTPLSDHIERAGLLAGAGGVLGGIGGFALVTITRPIATVEAVILGVLSLELEVPKLEFGITITITGAIGSIAILLFKTAEYYGAF